MLDQLAAAGYRSVVLCTGFLAQEVSRVFGENYGSLRLFYSQEQEPLGTGGALRLALPHLGSDPVLVMNGDSFCSIDLDAFRDWHCRRQATASMALARMERTGRYGRVKLGADARIVDFAEKKESAGPGWVNAGIYFLSQKVLQSIPLGANVSLERDIFPRWVGHGLYGYSTLGRFIDIGTPADFAAAENFFSGIQQTPERRFIVLDRDGTIIEEREYLSQPEQVRLIPGAAAALRELRQMGFGLVVITNQSGIGRGLLTAASGAIPNSR